MSEMTVRDIMISLDEYAVVDEDSTVGQVVRLLRQARERFGESRLPARAVLVRNTRAEICGQVGHLNILKALEPRYKMLGDLALLSRAGVSHEMLSSLMDNYRFLSGDLEQICAYARDRRAGEIMQPISESIAADAGLLEAVHHVVMTQAMRVLVTDVGQVIGLLRQADLFETVGRIIDPE